jgi:uncharacterized protein YkwD
MRKVLSLLVAGVLALLLVACSPEEATHLGQVNSFRNANGLPSLSWEEGAYAKARAWAQHMADQGKLSHSVLSQGIPPGWRLIGENVAMAPSLESAMTALQNSPPHRANLLNPKFNRVAIGVVQKGGYYWVTEDFIG